MNAQRCKCGALGSHWWCDKKATREMVENAAYENDICALCGDARKDHRDSSVGLVCRRSQLSGFFQLRRVV